MTDFLDAWGDPAEPHEEDACPTCGGSSFYKTPFGCVDDCEDEDNCYCDCHYAGETR